MLIRHHSPSLAPLLATLFAIGCGAALPEQDNSGQANVRYGSRVHKMPRRESSSITPNSAPAGAHLTYYGGRVVSNMQVVQVLWGTGSYLPQVSSTSTPSIASFYQQVLNSSYVDMFSEYDTNITAAGGQQGTNQSIGRGSFLRQVQITPSFTASTIDDSNIQSELAAQIQAGHLPPPTHDAAGNNNTYYAFFFPNGKTITQGGSSSCVSGGFCAYHGTVANVPGSGEVFYGVHPDMQAGSGCDTGCGSGTPFGNYTSVASHEMSETITDCEVGLATANAPPLAWYDQTNGENGDICNGQQGTFVGGDGVTYTVQQEFSNAANDCITSRTVTTTNDFSVSAANSSLTISSGSSGTDGISTAITSGSAESISLSASGQPAGVTVSFSPSSVNSGASSTMTVTVSSSAAAGTSTLTITGSAASGSHTTTVSLTVTSTTTTNDFSISASPSSLSFAPGGSGSSTISTAVSAGSAQTVSFSASGQPAGVSVSFSPSSVTAGSASTATVTSTSSAAPGTYSITVTGTGSSATHTAAISLTLTGSTGGGGLANGGFETGSLSGWSAAGASESVVSSGCHSGTYCARLGSTSPTNGDSTISQTFTAPSGGTSLSVWYKETCPDTITYDWALATLTDNTAGTTATVITKACATNSWTQATSGVTAGHSYTLTLTSHDDNYSADPTYTLFDDVSIATGTPPPPPTGGITNGGFESGLTGWTRSGTTSTTTVAHSGTGAALAGSTSPTNGDSSLSQTFTAPSGVSLLSLYYANNCPDSVYYDWVVVTLKDNTSGTTTTVVPETCASVYAWTNATSPVTAGHSYTLTLTNHDDDYAADPTYTLFDDVTLQ